MSSKPLLKTLESGAVAGVAGAGGGTALIAFANSLPQDSSLRLVILFATPSLGAALSWLWLVLQTWIVNYWNERQSELFLDEAEAVYERIVSDTNATVTQKQNAQRQLHDVRMHRAKLKIARSGVFTQSPLPLPEPSGAVKQSGSVQ